MLPLPVHKSQLNQSWQSIPSFCGFLFGVRVCLSVYLSVCLSVSLSLCLPVCLSVYLSVCLSLCLSVLRYGANLRGKHASSLAHFFLLVLSRQTHALACRKTKESRTRRERTNHST